MQPQDWFCVGGASSSVTNSLAMQKVHAHFAATAVGSPTVLAIAEGPFGYGWPRQQAMAPSQLFIAACKISPYKSKVEEIFSRSPPSTSSTTFDFTEKTMHGALHQAFHLFGGCWPRHLHRAVRLLHRPHDVFCQKRRLKLVV
eukprot:2708834-Amphidinium_carterae.1